MKRGGEYRAGSARAQADGIGTAAIGAGSGRECGRAGARDSLPGRALRLPQTGPPRPGRSGRPARACAVDARPRAVRTLLSAMKIYTRTGDDGTTGLLGSQRVPKHDARVEAYGSVDELNAALGVAAALDGQRELAPEFARFQAALFQVGAELASPDEAVLKKLVRIADDDIAALEHTIDRLEAELSPLTQFVLPGGTPLAAQLHFARTVCRRAERRATALAQSTAVDARIVKYLNRLADLLFVMARWSNHRAGVAETCWDSSRGT